MEGGRENGKFECDTSRMCGERRGEMVEIRQEWKSGEGEREMEERDRQRRGRECVCVCVLG